MRRASSSVYEGLMRGQRGRGGIARRIRGRGERPMRRKAFDRATWIGERVMSSRIGLGAGSLALNLSRHRGVTPHQGPQREPDGRMRQGSVFADHGTPVSQGNASGLEEFSADRRASRQEGSPESSQVLLPADSFEVNPLRRHSEPLVERGMPPAQDGDAPVRMTAARPRPRGGFLRRLCAWLARF